MLAVGPDPPAMQVTDVGADAYATEMRVVTDVDGEPAPHLRAAPPTRSPRLVAVAARVDQFVTLPVGRDPARPPTRLLEVALPHALAGRRARAAPEPPCPSTPTAGVNASKVRSSATRLGVRGEAPRSQRLDALVAHSSDLEIGVGHLRLRTDRASRARARRSGATPTARRRSCPRSAARRCV